jgi:hypothetical protein
VGGGRGCYAGQPISFACAKCRKRFDFFDNRCTVGRSWKLTGRTRRQLGRGFNVHGWGKTAHEYECLDCGHVGWSRHPDVARRAAHELGLKIQASLIEYEEVVDREQTWEEVAAEDATWD